MTPAFDDGPRAKYRIAGGALLLIATLVVIAIGMRYRGAFADTVPIVVAGDRSGLQMETGSKVVYNGVRVGRVTAVDAVQSPTGPASELTVEVESRYLPVIPANVDTRILSSTVFGNKYVSLTSPRDPVPARVHRNDVLRVDSDGVTTEFNTLFETLTSIAQRVDPVKLNRTLSATAQALDGMGERFGDSIGDGNRILDELNPRMPVIQHDVQQLAAVADIYARTAPALFDGLFDATTTAHTLNDQRENVDRALMAAVGFGETGGDSLERAAPYLERTAAESIPTTALFDEYSPMILCTIRNYHDVEPAISAAAGGNGYSTKGTSELVAIGNPYVYPDNLPRVNARGGPEGRPGCWQKITRDLWPAPYLVMDTGASIAPYNHVELGQPIATEYVWGRQIGENTINP